MMSGQVLDARPGTAPRRPRTSCTATAPSRRTCRRASLSSAPASSASSFWRISVFGLSTLPGAVRRAVHLAAPALDARERVQHLLPLDVRQRLEPDLLLLEIEIRHRREHRRPQVHRQRRQHRWKCFESGMSTRNAEDDQRVHPPVHARGEAGLPPEREQERDHQGQDEEPDEHRLARHVIPEGRGPDDRPPDEQPGDADDDRHGERHERQRVEVEPARTRSSRRCRGRRGTRRRCRPRRP